MTGAVGSAAMTSTATAPMPALVLVPGPVRAHLRWLRRAPIGVYASDAGQGWTALTPADTQDRPDDAAQILAARPVPRRFRPAVGFFVWGQRAVVTVQPPGPRCEQRWLIWQPGAGVVEVPGLPRLPLAMLASLGPIRPRPATLREVLADPAGSALTRLTRLLDVLGLPGADLLRGIPAAERTLVHPSPGTVRRFDAAVLERAARPDPEVAP